MAPKSKARVTEEDDYDSDGGFVEDDTKQPKRKKQKVDKPAAKASKGDDLPGGGARDDEGGVYWELSKNRRVTVSEYRGKRMIHLREYYLKDDKALPGKKGITLPLEQFSALIEVLPHIEKTLKDFGEDVPRPSYDDTEAETKPKPKKDTESDKKKNFEATSEEEGDDG